MKQTIIDSLYDIFDTYIIEKKLEKTKYLFEKTKNIEWGDYSTNIAMTLSKIMHKNPVDIANEISKNISSKMIKKITVTNPGFINVFLSDLYYDELLNDSINQNNNFGQFDTKGIIYNLEYVSANPTGSLHIGHARNAALGSTLSNIWEKYGIQVDKEYYINDGGAQINKLGVSVLVRYKQLFGMKDELPEDSYQGEEPNWVAKELKKKYENKFLKTEYDSLKITNLEERKIINDFSKVFLMNKIKETLDKFKVNFDIYFPESKILEDNLVDNSLKKLKSHLFEKDGATWLKTTNFGDDKDRVLIKNDKTNTYFLPDIAYHNLKLSRKKYNKIFDVLGSDHGSYVTRMKAACECLGYKDKLDVIIMQMVKLTKNGEPFKMSKRTGQSLTLNDLIESIGVDSSRWWLISQSANSHLEIDIDKVTKKDNSNAMYYVMYAHARIAQIILNFNNEDKKIISSKLTNIKERELMNLISYFPVLISSISNTYEVHSLNSFLYKIASTFHSYYSEIKIIGTDKDLTIQRINLIKSVKSVISSGLKLMEIEALEKI